MDQIQLNFGVAPGINLNLALLNGVRWKVDENYTKISFMPCFTGVTSHSGF